MSPLSRLTRDLTGIYLPVFYVMCGLAFLVVSVCGNAFVGVTYLISLHLVLWVPVGLVLVALQWFRSGRLAETVRKVPYLVTSPDRFRHVVGAVLGGFLVFVGLLVSWERGGHVGMLLATSISNIIPMAAAYMLGSVAAMLRIRLSKPALNFPAGVSGGARMPWISDGGNSDRG